MPGFLSLICPFSLSLSQSLHQSDPGKRLPHPPAWHCAQGPQGESCRQRGNVPNLDLASSKPSYSSSWQHCGVIRTHSNVLVTLNTVWLLTCPWSTWMAVFFFCLFDCYCVSWRQRVARIQRGDLMTSTMQKTIKGMFNRGCRRDLVLKCHCSVWTSHWIEIKQCFLACQRLQ